MVKKVIAKATTTVKRGRGRPRKSQTAVAAVKPARKAKTVTIEKVKTGPGPGRGRPRNSFLKATTPRGKGRPSRSTAAAMEKYGVKAEREEKLAARAARSAARAAKKQAAAAPKVRKSTTVKMKKPKGTSFTLGTKMAKRVGAKSRTVRASKISALKKKPARKVARSAKPVVTAKKTAKKK